MTKGDKVRVTVWGKNSLGTIHKIGDSGNIIFVIMDDNSGRVNWFHKESLTTVESKQND